MKNTIKNTDIMSVLNKIQTDIAEIKAALIQMGYIPNREVR